MASQVTCRRSRPPHRRPGLVAAVPGLGQPASGAVPRPGHAPGGAGRPTWPPDWTEAGQDGLIHPAWPQVRFAAVGHSRAKSDRQAPPAALSAVAVTGSISMETTAGRTTDAAAGL